MIVAVWALRSTAVMVPVTVTSRLMAPAGVSGPGGETALLPGDAGRRRACFLTWMATASM